MSTTVCSSGVSALTAIRVTSPDKHKHQEILKLLSFINDKSKAFVLHISWCPLYCASIHPTK